MAGRRPQTLEQKVGKGNPGRRPINESAPARAVGIPRAPAHFVGYALDCWNEYSALLQQRGQIGKESRVSLQALCECYAEWRELGDDIRANGRVQKVLTKAGAAAVAAAGEDGEVDPNNPVFFMERLRPAVGMYQDADRRLRQWLIEFGLTDASRGKVSSTGGGKDPGDPLGEFGLN